MSDACSWKTRQPIKCGRSVATLCSLRSAAKTFRLNIQAATLERLAASLATRFATNTSVTVLLNITPVSAAAEFWPFWWTWSWEVGKGWHNSSSFRCTAAMGCLRVKWKQEVSSCKIWLSCLTQTPLNLQITIVNFYVCKTFVEDVVSVETFFHWSHDKPTCSG